MRKRALASLAVRNAISSAFERSSGVLAAIVLTPFLLLHLGRDNYGVMTATASAFEYLILLRGGLGAAMRRHVTIRVHTGHQEEARRVYQAGFWWGLILRAPILIVGLILAGPLCRFVHLPENLLADATKGVSLLIFAAVLADTAVIFEVPRYVTGDTSPISVIMAMAPIVRIVLVFVLFRFLMPGLSLYGAIVVMVQAALVVSLVILAQRSRSVGPVFPRPGLGDGPIRKELFSYGGLALLGQGAGLLYVTTDNLFIGRIYGTAAVAFYSMGARWMPLIRSFLVSAIRPLAPLFTQLEAQADRERTRSVLLRTIAMASAMAVPFCLVPCVLGDLFLKAWVGPSFTGAWAFMLVSLAPSVFDIALSPVWAMLVGWGRIGWVSTGDLIVAIGNVALSLILALHFHLGLLGFALGNGIALLVKNLILAWLVARREEAMPPFPLMLLPIAKALAGGAPALILLALTRDFYAGSLVKVIAAGIVAGLLCLAGSVLVAVKRDDLKKIVRTVMNELPASNSPAGIA